MLPLAELRAIFEADDAAKLALAPNDSPPRGWHYGDGGLQAIGANGRPDPNCRPPALGFAGRVALEATSSLVVDDAHG
ncbi:hypothetical protein DFR70_108201 [Nocardia tenerifensis]|uniref:Uncharacterized protein n=1 Tax=Nocardia tenerifensis TaxID=228006 RepID=A0A318JW07_9NOCA|nr:hypothetical protein [Nocardia tenerifensis]PXX61643.1 hypothetical protein DFR70_108201 [Nocardia tenerifensis]